MARHITPPHSESRGSDFELAYASPTVTKEQGADTESIRRYKQKCRGPLSLNDEAGTLYPDGRNRRLRGASDDEANPTVDGFFVEHLRVGGPYLCPMPVYSDPLEGRHDNSLKVKFERRASNYQSIHARVEKILDNLGIEAPSTNMIEALGKNRDFLRMDYKSIYLLPRVSGRCPGPKQHVDTLIIWSTRYSLEDPWLECVRELRSLLCREGLAHVCVEIVDWKAYGMILANQGLFTFPVHARDEIFAKWDSVLGVILETIDLTDICSISCYRRGRSKDVEDNPPTVLIIADTESDRCWKGTRDKVVEILNNFCLYMVAVEISKDSVMDSITINEGIPPTLLEAGNTKAGDSIALHQNTQSSGTLGGFVELQDPETRQWHPYALTCFTCVDPGNLGDDVSSKIEQWRREGIFNPSETDKELLSVDHPSLLAKNEQLEYHRPQISSWESSDDWREWDAEDQEFFLKHKGQIEKIENYFRDALQHLGYVTFASGHRFRNVYALGDKSYPTSLDWALISVSPERKPSNEIEDMLYLENHLSGAEMRDLHARRVVTGGYRSGTSPNEYYSSNNMYSGLVDAHLSTVTVDGQSQQRVTLGWRVVVGPMIDFGSRGPLFSRPGDEGALVYTLSGKDVVGMLVGVAGFNNISRIIRVDHLFNDIKRSTGSLAVRFVQR